MTESTIYEMELKVDNDLLRLLPGGVILRKSPDFADKVSREIRKLFNEVGGVITAMSVSSNELSVSWKDEGSDPLNGIVYLLERSKYNEAVILLELFKSSKPDDPDFLYNLGMAYSDMGEFQKAIANLGRLLELIPDHVNGRVALGVALMRKGKDKQALSELTKAVQDDPDNPWAQRNLGGCLLNLGDHKQALRHLKKATELNPNDERAWYGLGQAYELDGNLDNADSVYQKVLELDEFSEVAEKAREARSGIARKTFRSVTPGMERMDAVMYCLDALEKFENMTPSDVQQVGFEVAIIGMQGIDINDPSPKYKLKSLSGNFSGLHLLCLEYVSFKQFEPDMDIGFDLSSEYKSAMSLFQRSKHSGE
jgi:tetratricopeptide (TPR) repeat protein